MSSSKDGIGSSTTPSPPVNNEFFLAHRLCEMRRSNNLSEWQLQAVLFKAKLTQYFDIFISQGGDDIDQIMQCDEQEFLEIMSLVGMASKPLHVRRLQRTLNEFSLNRAQFLISSVPFIGFPPVDISHMGNSPSENLLAALRFLVPGQTDAQNVVLSCGNFENNEIPKELSSSNSTTSSNCALINDCMQTKKSSSTSYASVSSSTTADAACTTAVSATANVLPFSDNVLMSLVNASSSSVCAQTFAGTKPLISTAAVIEPLLSTSPLSFFAQQQQVYQQQIPYAKTFIQNSFARDIENIASSSEKTEIKRTNSYNNNKKNNNADLGVVSDLLNPQKMISDIGSENDTTAENATAYQLFEIPSLTPAEVERLAQIALTISEKMPNIEARLIQNKKKISRELLDVMSIPASNPSRNTEFRRFSAIYRRFDAKRKPDKALSFHEALVNEAAAQLCMRRPELLTRRDELFPLARKLVRLAGFFGPRTSYGQRRNSEESNDNDEDNDMAMKSSEHSRTTSRSSLTTNSTSSSPIPSAKFGIPFCKYNSGERMLQRTSSRDSLDKKAINIYEPKQALIDDSFYNTKSVGNTLKADTKVKPSLLDFTDTPKTAKKRTRTYDVYDNEVTTTNKQHGTLT